MGTRHNPYWDNLKSVLIALVVLGHFIQVFLERAGGEYPLLEAILCTIYFFHMPLFVFVSGYLSKNIARRREGAFVDLLLPYVAAQLCWWLYGLLSGSPSGVLDNIFYPQFALWYLLALFTWRMLAPDLIRVRWIMPVSAALFVVGQAFEGIDNAFAMQRTIGFFAFFLMGYKADGELLEYIGRLQRGACAALLACVFFGLFALFSFTGVSYGGLFAVLSHAAHLSAFSNMFVGIVSYCFAFVAAVVLSSCVMRLVPSSELFLLTRMGSNTMPVYLTHGLVVYIVIDYWVISVGAPAAMDCIFLLSAATLTYLLLSSRKYTSLFNRALSQLKRAVYLDKAADFQR